MNRRMHYKTWQQLHLAMQARKDCSVLSFLARFEVGCHNVHQQIISVNLPNKFADVKMICDVGRILGQQVSDNLADRVVSFLLQRLMDAH